MNAKKIFTGWLYTMIIVQMIMLPVAPVLAVEADSIMPVAIETPVVIQPVTEPIVEPIIEPIVETSVLAEINEPQLEIVPPEITEPAVMPETPIEKAIEPIKSEIPENVSLDQPVVSDFGKSLNAKILTDNFPIAEKAVTVGDDGKSYEVVDALTDVAYDGDGKKTYKVYSEPRMIYESASGLKVRPAGWNLFEESPTSQTKDKKVPGYGFKVPLGKNAESELTTTVLEIGKKSVNAKIPEFEKYDKDNATITEYKNVFDNIDVRLIDRVESRSKEIVINQPPKNLKLGENLIFWDTYSFPEGAAVYNSEGKEITGSEESTGTYIYIESAEKGRFYISGANVYDERASDPTVRELSGLLKPLTQINEVNFAQNTLRVGVKLDASYLLSKETVFPVVIDPVYYSCAEVLPGGTDVGCSMTEFYLRYKTGNSIAEGKDSTALYSGCAIDVDGKPLTRHAIMKYNINFPANEEITVARLYMHSSSRTGIGVDSSTDLTVKSIGFAWNTANARNLTYTQIKDTLSQASQFSVPVNKVGENTWKDWEITNMVKFWKSNPAQNYGLVVEPAPAWNYANQLPAGWKRATVLFDSRSAANAFGPYISFATVAQQSDLTRDSYTLPTSTYRPGETIDFHVTIRNVGVVASPNNVKLRYYLNKDNTSYVQGQMIEDSFNSLAVNGTTTRGLSYAIPAGTAPGQYFLSYFIDATGVAPESNENNNKFTHAITINPSLPDLTYNTARISTNNVLPGSAITLNVDVINNGGDSGASSYVYYYWKKDSATYNNTYYIGEDYFPQLGTGSGSSESFTYTVPAGATPGTYYLYFWIDAPQSISEPDENNNKYAFAVTVNGTQDLQPTNFTITNPTSKLTGDSITIHGLINNYGTIAANNVPYTLRLRNSDTGEYFNMINIGPVISPISAGSSAWVDLTATIPDTLPLNGLYNAQIILDPLSTIPETNENNNSVLSSTAIQIERRNIGGGDYDYDDDNQSDVAEVVGGTNMNGDQSTVELIDKVKIATVKSVPSDNKVAYSGVQFIGLEIYANAKNQSVSTNDGGDPVNLRNGALEFEQTDFVLPAGAGFPLQYSRTYNSKLYDWNSRLGNGWSHSYELFYYQDEATKDVQVYLGGALATVFSCPTNDCTPTAGGFLVPMKGSLEKMNKENGSFVYQTISGVKYYFSKKVDDQMYLAERIVDPNGNAVSLDYTDIRAVPLLSKISVSPTRYLSFTYPADTGSAVWDKIQEVRSNIGGEDKLVARYTYDANKHLIAVHQESTYSGEAVKNIDRAFTYDATGKMLTYADPRGTVLYNDYDSDGRVINQYEKNPRLGANDNRKIYKFEYLPADAVNAPGSVHCTKLTTYRALESTYEQTMCFNIDELKIYEKKGTDVERWAYNEGGMISAYTNQVGVVTNYEYDADRRMTGEILPDIDGKHTVVTYEYWNNPSRLKKKIETVSVGGSVVQTRETNLTVAQDSRGNISAAADAMGNVERFTYNANGTINTFTNKLGTVITYAYDANGYRISETATTVQADNSNQTVLKQYINDAYGRLTGYTDPNGNVYAFAYDSRGNLRQETKPGNVLKTSEYDVEDHKITATDEEGRITRFVFDNDINASLLSITQEHKTNPNDENNLVYSKQYDWAGNLVKETDPLDREVSYFYDSANRVVGKTDAQKTTSYEYFANGQLKKETNTEGQRADYLYDARGNKTEVRNYIDAGNFVSAKLEYDGLNRAVKTTDANTNQTQFVYNNVNALTSSIASDGGISEFFYDNAGNKVGERNPLAQADASLRNATGYSVGYTYDGLNRLIKSLNANNKETQNFYDGNGNLIKVIDRQEVDGTNNTHQTQFEYFANNLKKKEIYADGGIVEYTYDKVGNLKSKKDQENRTWTFNYDDFNRMTAEIDPSGKTTAYAFDKVGNKTSVTYPDNTKSVFVYNSLNMLMSVKDAQDYETQFTYDAVGNKLTERDKNKQTTTFVYDKLNRLISETNPHGTGTVHSYDNNGNRLTEIVDGITTAYEYDSSNRLTSITYPGNKTEHWTYDKNSNKLTYVNGNSQSITFAYDKLNRLTIKHLPDGDGFNVVYVYDNWSNLTRMIDQSGTTDYTYDLVGRNTTETKAINGLANGKTISRTYNLSGQLSSLTDIANRTIGYSYNNRAMLSSVNYGGTTLAEYTYNNFGKPSVVTFGNGVVSTYSYDSLNRTSGIETKNSAAKTIFKQEYEYDPESNRAKMIETRIDEFGSELQATVNYTYDSLGQLTLVDNMEPVGGISNDFTYAYDARGNRTAATTPVDAASYTYANGTNELSVVSYNAGLMTVDNQYDNNGSLLKETIKRLEVPNKEVNYAWDSENKLVGISYKFLNQPPFLPQWPDNTLAFVYDDFGNRVKKTSNSEDSTYYINDGVTVLNELDASGAVRKTMVKGIDAVAEIDKDGIIQYIHADVLGSAVVLTNALGEVVHQYEYEAFGRIASDIGNLANETNYTFTNQEFDSESELYYCNARYYNPRLGRFISRDPVLGRDGDTLSRNLYVYVKNNPLKYTDPTGKFWSAFGMSVLQLGKTVLDVGAVVGQATLAGMVLPFQPGASAVLFGGAIANLDNAMVDSTNSLNNFVNAVTNKPPKNILTQGPYRDFANELIGDTQLIDMAQIGGDILSFSCKDAPEYIGKMKSAIPVLKNSLMSGVGNSSIKYVAKKTNGIIWEGANLFVETVTGGNDIVDLFEQKMMQKEYLDNK